uniref:hypothetical protein n=1 Tax=Neorhizobium sp. EC2-8 TaxID=3129230 RepID=UPI003100BF0C
MGFGVLDDRFYVNGIKSGLVAFCGAPLPEGNAPGRLRVTRPYVSSLFPSKIKISFLENSEECLEKMFSGVQQCSVLYIGATDSA